MKFLNADEVKFQLTTASLYLTAYELLIESIVQKTKDFFTNGFKDGEWVIDDKYKTIVRALCKEDIVVASAMWLQNLNVITDKEVEKIKMYKEHRNDIAHELPKIISDSDYNIKTEHFIDIRNLYYKIQLWWFKEIELTTNPDFDEIDHDNLDYDEALSIVMLPMEYMVNIVNDEIEKRNNNKT